jgi:hypothetical protein
MGTEEFLEEEMKEETALENQVENQKKKTYIKPAMSMIQLIAEEAVLATCKTGVQNRCAPNPVCTRIRRS